MRKMTFRVNTATNGKLGGLLYSRPINQVGGMKQNSAIASLTGNGAAAIDRAAEAEAPVVLTPEAAGPATRLAPIVSRMYNAAASLAPGTPSGIGEVAITGEQQLVEWC